MVRWLVGEGGAAVNQVNNHGITPLMVAAQNGNYGTVRFLASARAQLTDPTNELWQNEEVQRALIQGCQDRLLPLLRPLLRDALLLPPDRRPLLPELLPFVLDYALPATWEDVQEELRGVPEA